LHVCAAIFGMLEPVQDEEVWWIQSNESAEGIAAWKTTGEF